MKEFIRFIKNFDWLVFSISVIAMTLIVFVWKLSTAIVYEMVK